jgi:hypothetical protein
VCWSEKLEQFYKNQKREILTEEGKWGFRKWVFRKIGDTFQRENYKGSTRVPGSEHLGHSQL